MRKTLPILAILLVSGVLLSPGTAAAQMVTALTATLVPTNTAPAAIDTAAVGATNAANASRASGAASFTVDHSTRLLRWQITYSGLSSDPTAAHIHTGGGQGVTPTTVVDLGTGNPIVGSTTIDDTQLADLLAGRTFVDIHTKLNQDGEISGQIAP